MEEMPNTWYDAFLQLFALLNDYIYNLAGMLPNPDPFPNLIANMDIELVDGYRVAWYWLDSAFNMEIMLNVFSAYFAMFAIGWIILMLWKWSKAR